MRWAGEETRYREGKLAANPGRLAPETSPSVESWDVPPVRTGQARLQGPAIPGCGRSPGPSPGTDARAGGGATKVPSPSRVPRMTQGPASQVAEQKPLQGSGSSVQAPHPLCRGQNPGVRQGLWARCPPASVSTSVRRGVGRVLRMRRDLGGSGGAEAKGKPTFEPVPISPSVTQAPLQGRLVKTSLTVCSTTR